MNSSLFVSDRERRLWTWVAAVVVAIYATLGLAQSLAEELQARDLFVALFLLGMVMIGAAIVALAIRFRPGGAEIGVDVRK